MDNQLALYPHSDLLGLYAHVTTSHQQLLGIASQDY